MGHMDSAPSSTAFRRGKSVVQAGCGKNIHPEAPYDESHLATTMDVDYFSGKRTHSAIRTGNGLVCDMQIIVLALGKTPFFVKNLLSIQ